eukprot:349632-Chlamydomonas_euryale.AAC.3
MGLFPGPDTSAAAICPACTVHAYGFEPQEGGMLGVDIHGRVESFVGTLGRSSLHSHAGEFECHPTSLRICSPAAFGVLPLSSAGDHTKPAGSSRVGPARARPAGLKLPPAF